MEAERRVTSFREQSALANLIITVIVVGAYKVQTIMAGPNVDPGKAVGAFIGTIVTLVTLIVIVNIVLAIRTPQEPRDERDLSIDRTAYRNAYFALNVGVWTALPMVLLWCGMSGATQVAAGLEGGTAIRPAVIGQALFLCFAFAECVKLATQAYLYRRSA